MAVRLKVRLPSPGLECPARGVVGPKARGGGVSLVPVVGHLPYLPFDRRRFTRFHVKSDGRAEWRSARWNAQWPRDWPPPPEPADTSTRPVPSSACPRTVGQPWDAAEPAAPCAEPACSSHSVVRADRRDVRVPVAYE